MKRLSRSNKLKKVAFLIVLAWEVQAFGDDFRYFGSEIDYWHENLTKESATKSPNTPPIKPQPSDTSKGKLSWEKYLDPNNKEFFKEGDYTPPEPFIEVVKNPTDSNLKMWFAYIDKKNALSMRLQERMQEYLAKNAPKLEVSAQDSLRARLASLPVTAPNAKRYRFRMYFDSHCPHCKKMFGTLTDLQSRGFYVEAKQVDSAPRGLEGLGIPTTRATPGELKEKDIQSVPVLLIGDLEKKEVYRLTGYQSTQAIFAAIQQTKQP